MNSFAHLSFGLALAEIFGLSPVLTALASLAPDVDFYFTHRGPLHNPAIVLLALPLPPEKKRPILFGYLSHLLLDCCTPMGVPLLFTRFSLDLPSLEPFVILFSLALLLSGRLRSLLLSQRRRLSIALAVFLLLRLSPIHPIIPPGRLILEERRGRAVTYGFARKLPARFGRTLHQDSELSLHGFSLLLSDFEAEGWTAVVGFYEPAKREMVRVRKAPLLG